MTTSIKQYPKVATLIKQMPEDKSKCNIYVNLAPLGDVCLDHLQKSDNPHYTHMYIIPFGMEFFDYRLRDNEVVKLQADGVLSIECSAFFYQNNQAMVSRPRSDVPEFPACLFSVELNKDGSFKNKTFRGAINGKYSSKECYNQIVCAEPSEKILKAQVTMKTTQNIVVPEPQTGIAQSIAMMCLEKYGKVIVDGTTIEIPAGVYSGN